MKLSIVALCLTLLFTVGGYCQTKKPAPKQTNLSTIRISSKRLLLQKQKQQLETEREQLLVRYSSENPRVVEKNQQIVALDKELSTLPVLEMPGELSEIYEADINSNELMKILIIQNQRIIELLEKIAKPK
jgi:hypothetical protein